MPATRYRVGQIVTHPTKQGWGPGKVLAVQGAEVTVYFRDAPEVRRGDAIKRINTTVVALDASGPQSDPWLDAIPPFRDGGFDIPERRMTLQESFSKFQLHFPGAFADPEYLRREREYKWRAHEIYESKLGGGRGEALLAQNDVDEVIGALLSVERAVNLLSPFEKAALADAFRDRDAAAFYAAALSQLVSGPARDETSLSRLIGAVTDLRAEEGRRRVATWTVLTIMPFLAQPTRFMFLEPEVTKKAADRLAFHMGYTPKLNTLTYLRLLTMSDLLLDALRAFGAVDYIDVQSFIWVTGSYPPDAV